MAQLASTTGTHAGRKRRDGRLFLIEALMLLVFCFAAIAVATQLLTSADRLSTHAQATTTACLVAGNESERFAADPDDAESTAYYALDGSPLDGESEGCLLMHRTAESDATEAGTSFYATITVERNGEELICLNTTHYLSGASSAEQQER